jgi:hypothetical protein
VVEIYEGGVSVHTVGVGSRAGGAKQEAPAADNVYFTTAMVGIIVERVQSYFSAQLSRRSN